VYGKSRLKEVVMKKKAEGVAVGETEDVGLPEAQVREASGADEDEDEVEDKEGEDGPALDELEIWEASSLDLEDVDEDEDPSMPSAAPSRR
jgi:hypothetical protein